HAAEQAADAERIAAAEAAVAKVRQEERLKLNTTREEMRKIENELGKEKFTLAGTQQQLANATQKIEQLTEEKQIIEQQRIELAKKSSARTATIKQLQGQL